jgi:hypothetical protein
MKIQITNIKQKIFLSVSCIVLSLASVSISQAGLYRWVDGSGKVHFSDKIPPSSSQKGHSELNKDGIEKKKVLSAKEIKKIKDEAEKKAVENQQIALKRENEKQILREKRKHDVYLLSTFDSKDELIHYYESKIVTLSETANILITRNENLAEKITKVSKKQKAAKTKSLQQSFGKDLARLNKSFSQYEKALKDNKEEISRLTKKYKRDLKRYDELSQLTSSL